MTTLVQVGLPRGRKCEYNGGLTATVAEPAFRHPTHFFVDEGSTHATYRTISTIVTTIDMLHRQLAPPTLFASSLRHRVISERR